MTIIDYKDFFKSPIVGVLFMCLIAISYLYIDNRTVYKEQINKQEKRIDKLEKDNFKKDSIITDITIKLINLERRMK
jgi:hypothetical protein